jgi:hypothetical protein
MQIKKPVPSMTQDNKPRRLCPVCGKVSYSRGGMHPQCSQTREDAPRIARLKAAKKAELQKRAVANAALLSHDSALP